VGEDLQQLAKSNRHFRIFRKSVENTLPTICRRTLTIWKKIYLKHVKIPLRTRFGIIVSKPGGMVEKVINDANI
jgi:hypothetical protein